ncbi:hypothetical protein BJ508DRAFT_317011 [Ascobolus immersus RN42]|uniref:Transglutaminase-like domain-containing protein n=1 Tax=Ascobolus immersus RN42 TaxID=1160509 RepID=A0A3N4IY54_ASCIM|nr:hypothetical protein BJ508DRAFT_317011 [Ascobolus immersus RN42]
MAACLICRDFKRPDAHAARPEFDRMRATSISGLALSLTEPFSDTIDKARVIFTWLHHNVAYDADGFFARNIGPQGPENTMRTGLAVCDGYAQLYKALANAAGLKCEKVSGFGAGFGFTDKNLPSEYKSNHAWNAILFPEPHGWHLIDSCWGAGVLGHDQKYCKKFNPSQFISSPKDFGKRHFPGEARWQCILNPISYAQFASPKPGPKVYGGGQDWKVHSITPWVPALPAGRVRIELERSCAHLKAKKGGQAEYLICAWTSGTKRPLPFREVDQFGTIAVEIDVNSGDKVNVGPLTTINGKDAKGVTADEWISQMNRAGWGCNSYLVTYGHD